MQPKICMLKFRKKAAELSFKSFAKQSEILQQCKTIVLRNFYENFAEISVEVKLRRHTLKSPLSRGNSFALLLYGTVG